VAARRAGAAADHAGWLGLAISRKLARMMGGDVTVASEAAPLCRLMARNGRSMRAGECLFMWEKRSMISTLKK
jgi:signal transduction histidine kinase